MKKKIILTSVLFFLLLSKNNCQFIGKIVDKTTNMPLQGVSIQVNRYKGTVSNEKGYFNLMMPENVDRILLTFSYVGYQKIEVVFKPNVYNLVELEPSNKSLKEVIVSTSAKSLIERAIKRIPVNYPSKPSLITGIARVYNIVNDTDYYYHSDAILKVYTPSYCDGGKQDIKLIQNKFVLLENKKSQYFNNPSKSRWVGQYYATNDFVLYNSDFININHIKDYDYYEKDQIYYENRKVYVVDFESKARHNIEGTIYIDTATLAFMRFDITSYNLKELFYLPISLSKISTSYQMIGEKWYLKNSNGESRHVIKGTSLYSRDFIVTSLDTLNVKPFDYSDILQRRDENIKTFKEGTISDWVVYDSIFKAQEIAELMRKIEVPNIDTTTPKKKTNIFLSALGYIRKNDNLRFSVALGKQAIDSKNSKYGSLVEYGFSFGIIIRVYKNLFFQRGTTTAYGLGGIPTHSNNYLLDYEFKVNKNHRPIAIMPYAGYSYIKIKKDELNIDQTFKSWVVGVNTSIELTHKKSFFIAPAYHYNYYQGGTYTGIQPTNFSINIGFIFKR